MIDGSASRYSDSAAPDGLPSAGAYPAHVIPAAVGTSGIENRLRIAGNDRRLPRDPSASLRCVGNRDTSPPRLALASHGSFYARALPLRHSPCYRDRRR